VNNPSLTRSVPLPAPATSASRRPQRPGP
jgi:hypothetical protein